MSSPSPCNVPLVYPKFSAESFWNYSVTAEPGINHAGGNAAAGMVRIYDPAAFCARVERLISMLNVRVAGEDHPADNFRRRHGLETVRRIVNRFPEYHEVLWRTFCVATRSIPAPTPRPSFCYRFSCIWVPTRAGSSQKQSGRSRRSMQATLVTPGRKEVEGPSRQCAHGVMTTQRSDA
jgi:hypothetical protein